MDVIESYAATARRWWADEGGSHSYWCPCLACADLRCHQRRVPLVTIVGGRVIPLLPLGRRLP